MLIEINNASAISKQKQIRVYPDLILILAKKYLEYFYTFFFFVRKYYEKFGM